jgi:hypothetical protein
MRRITFFHTAWALLALVFCVSGCGGKQQGQEVNKAPEPVLPKARTCPGAMPGDNIQVTTAIGESNAPVIVWTGEAYALAWWDLRGRFPTVHTIRLDQNGTARSLKKKLPNKASARDQALAWDGKDLHMVWSDGGRIVSQRFGGAGGDPIILAEKGQKPAASAWGAAVWINGGRIFFRSDGMAVNVKPTVIATGGIETPQIAYNGVFYAVVWSSSVKGGREILLQRVSPKGRKLGARVRVSATAGVSRKPMIAWAGSNFAISWTNAAPADQNPLDRFRVFFAIVPDAGDTPLMTRQLAFQGSADQVALASTGKEFGLAWVGSRKPRGTAIYLQRIGLDGNPMDETVEVTDGVPLTCGRPSLAWGGDGYAVTWHDDRANTGAEVFFSYVECGDETIVPISIPEPEPEPEPETAAEPTDPETPEAPLEEPALKGAFGDDGVTAKKEQPTDEKQTAENEEKKADDKDGKKENEKKNKKKNKKNKKNKKDKKKAKDNKPAKNK